MREAISHFGTAVFKVVSSVQNGELPNPQRHQISIPPSQSTGLLPIFFWIGYTNRQDEADQQQDKTKGQSCHLVATVASATTATTATNVATATTLTLQTKPQPQQPGEEEEEEENEEDEDEEEKERWRRRKMKKQKKQQKQKK